MQASKDTDMDTPSSETDSSPKSSFSTKSVTSAAAAAVAATAQKKAISGMDLDMNTGPAKRLIPTAFLSAKKPVHISDISHLLHSI